MKRSWLALSLAAFAFAPSARAQSTTVSEWQSQLVANHPTTPFRIPLDMPVQAPLQPGQLVEAAYTPFTAPMAVTKNNAYGLLSSILAGAQTNFALGYQAIPVASTAPQHPAWEADGYTVSTCDEYAYKRYYDYKRFQDAAATCGGNPDCVYNLWVSSGVGGENRTMLARSALQGPIVPAPGSSLDPAPGTSMQQLKNAMRDPTNVAAFKQALLMASTAGSPAAAADQANYAQLADYLYSPEFSSNSPYYTITGPRAVWHKQMHDQQATYGETPTERAVIKQRVVNVMSLLDAYNTAVFNYNAAIEAQDQYIIKACGGLAAPPPGMFKCTPQTPQYCKPPPPPPSPACIAARNDFPTAALQADEDAAAQLSAALYAEYTNIDPISGATDNGCLSLSHNKCDWTPSMIGSEYLTSIDSNVQSDLNMCDDIVGTGSVAQLDGALQSALGAGAPAATADEVDAFEGILDDLAIAAAVRSKLAWMQSAPDTIHYDLFSGPQSWSVGGQFAGASYTQNAFWEVRGEKNTAGKLCRLSGRVYGAANATATLLGQPLTVLDADLQIGAGELVNDGGASAPDYAGFETESHLTIGPYSIYSFPDTRTSGPSLDQTLAHQHWDQNILTVQGQIYFVNLVLQVNAVADLDVSLTGVAPAVACASVTDASQNTFGIGANVTPSVSAQVVGTALVGALGTGIGVQGTVDLVTATLPINVDVGVGPDPSGAGDLALNFNANASLDVSVLSGEFDVAECFAFQCATQELFRWSGIPAYHAPHLWNLTDSFPLIAVQTALE